MTIYNKIKQLSELKSIDKLSNNMEVLLAHLRKNYKTGLSNINQNAIISMSQEGYENSGVEVPIVLSFKDGSVFRIIVKNGDEGPQGRQGKEGEAGEKGDYPYINAEYAQSKGVIDWLNIANDSVTDDSTKVISALQGVNIAEALEQISETFMTEYQYALLFTDHVTIDAEFETFENNQLVQLIAEDPDTHQRYVKYWTFESDGEQEYFVFNYHGQTYDSVYADIWEDIYMGGNTGFFEATTQQMKDGTTLYVKDNSINDYKTIDQFTDPIYVFGITEDGTEGYMPGNLNEGEGPWFVKEYLKNESGEYIEYYTQVSQEYIDKNSTKIYGQRDFTYYLTNADCIVDVKYTMADGYDFNLHAKQLPENIWLFDHVDEEGNNVYMPTNFASVDVNAPIVYYKKVGDAFETISSIKEYIKKKEYRYYKVVEGTWQELEYEIDENKNHIVNIDYDNYEEYIVVHYVDSSNTNTFTHYKHVKTLREEYYEERSSILNPYTIKYYAKYTDDEPRRYFTRRIITSEDKLGNTVFEYLYKEIKIPFWLEAEFITEIEDQNIRILSRNPEEIEIGDEEIIDPVYISSIEFENSEIEIAKNYNKDIKVTIYPENANVTNMIMEYDSSIINIYEDGRIAALSDDSVTKETTIKVYSEKDNSIGDKIKVRIVTPVEKIYLNTSTINLYPGTSFKLEPVIYPEIVTNNNLVYTISDSQMLSIDADNNVYPTIDKNGNYKTGNCELKITAADGFGAELVVPVLVAVPISNIKITSRSFAFVGKSQQVTTEVMPYDATLVLLDYSSSNEGVATVSETGLVKPLSEGETILTCSSKDGSGVKASQKLIVSTGIDEIKIHNLQSSIEVGLTNNIEIEVLPENASNKNISIFVSDNSVINYTEPMLKQGTTNIYEMSITGVFGGSTQFVVSSTDGSETYAEQELTIPIPIKDIKFEEPNIVIYEGDESKIIRTIVTGPESVANNSLEWYSDNIKAATVDIYGRLNPVKVGKAKISAISKDENKVIGTCNVTVKKHTQEIILNNNDIDTKKIVLNSFGFIPASIKPYDASDQILRWKSSNENICMVEDNGTIYGKSLGNAIITASAIDRSDLSVSINVEVVKQIDDNN